MKPPYSLSDEELRLYADNHIKYEIDMLLWISAILPTLSQVKTDWPIAWACSNSSLNSYSIHARNLIDFLYLRSLGKDRDNDIIIQDYIDDAVLFSKLPPISPLLKEAKRKADKQVVHLSLERNEYEIKGKEWHFLDITQSIMHALFSISQVIPESRISNDLRMIISKPNISLPEVTAELIKEKGISVGVSLRVHLAEEN